MNGGFRPPKQKIHAFQFKIDPGLFEKQTRARSVFHKVYEHAPFRMIKCQSNARMTSRHADAPSDSRIIAPVEQDLFLNIASPRSIA